MSLDEKKVPLLSDSDDDLTKNLKIKMFNEPSLKEQENNYLRTKGVKYFSATVINKKRCQRCGRRNHLTTQCKEENDIEGIPIIDSMLEENSNIPNFRIPREWTDEEDDEPIKEKNCLCCTIS